jgi:ligand-binding sensor domain-containing protein
LPYIQAVSILLMVRILVLIFLFLIPGVASAQTPNYLFYNTGEKNGLSSNFVYAILKDSRGFMWAATHNGLNRYDGHHFYPFHARQSDSSFVNNSIFDICEDKEGNIWGATGSGIFRYNVTRNTFRNYIPPGYDYARGVHNIICDSKGTVWATGLWTILRLNKEKDSFEEIGPLTSVKDSLPFYSVRKDGLLADPQGKGVWLATRMGLHFYNSAGNRFDSYKNQGSHPLFAKESVVSMNASRFGYFWFFNNITKEAIAFDPASRKTLRRIYLGEMAPGAYGYTLFEDANRKLWFSTNVGMFVIDYLHHNYLQLHSKNDNPLSVAGVSFADVIEDRDNNIFLATSGGISRCNYTRNVYNIYPVTETIKEFADGRLGAISIDPRDNSWWLASTANPSVAHYFPGTGKYDFYDFKKAPINAAGSQPSYVFNVDFLNNEPYLFTHTGIWRVNEAGKTLSPFTFLSDKGLTPINWMRKDSICWLITAAGFVKWNTITGQAIRYSTNTTMLPDGQKIVFDNGVLSPGGRPWFIPAFGWLAYLDDNNNFKFVYYIHDKPKELASYITRMEFEGEETLWMSSLAAGMYRYNTSTSRISLIDKIPSVGTAARNFTIDPARRLWVTSFKNITLYHPATGATNSYHIPLYDNKFDFETDIEAAKDSSVYCVFNKDIIHFLPKRIDARPLAAAALISMVKVAGKDRFINQDSILKLEPDENSLDFNFGSFINNEVYPYNLQYKMEGVDERWIQSGPGRRALYNNLQPGKYLFKVKAVANNNAWQSRERIISLHIRTPFYKATWFWILLGASLLASIILFYRFRLHKQRQILTLETKAEQLEKEKTMVRYDGLKQQLNPHFLFNSLTSLSGLIETNQQMAVDFLGQMSDIYRYILQKGDTDIVPLRDELKFAALYIQLQQTRFKKGLLVRIDVPDEYLDYKIAPVTLQNLMENAIKHNIIDQTSPLVIEIFVEDKYLLVKNNLQKKSNVETSNKRGLAQFVTLYNYLSPLPVLIEETTTHFNVKIPLI